MMNLFKNVIARPKAAAISFLNIDILVIMICFGFACYFLAVYPFCVYKYREVEPVNINNKTID
jgi:hypothetical protein